jgi:GNAT superfamily N-acetyltransferase
MEIRRAQETDLDLLVRLRLTFLSEIRDVEPAEIRVQIQEGTRAFIDEHHRSGQLLTWIAEDEGQTLGIVSVVLHDVPPLLEDGRTKEDYVINEYVIPSARGRGVGRQLLQAALESAQVLGVRQFRLVATPDGASMYRSEGFAPHDRFMARSVPIDPITREGVAEEAE